ncbi:YrzE family protein [Methanobacterium sp.]|uniref:YrzE family protein n=1 Tax=Methanobacterium sp. TaxID=2164 RepID=UPI002ABCAA9C|nr:YrzE family protein [Methanobacterium sp.]MDY9923571.1 YrzE family protein [Methanobacterium sp.]
MQNEWQCINVECDYKEYGKKGDKCPKCGKSFYKVNSTDSKMMFEIKDRNKSANSSRKNKFHPVIAIIIGYFIAGSISGFLRFLLNIPLSSEISAIFTIILGGFIATYISRTNKPMIGLYNGLLYSLGYLIGVIYILKTELTFYSVLILVLVFPISGLVGGYFAKVLRSRLDKKNEKNLQ